MNFLQLPECVLVHASKLSGLQLAILADAWTWERQGKEARRSNEQLAELFGATTRGVTKAVKALEELGLVELHYGANNIRHIKPRTTVHLNDRSPRTTVHPERPFTPPLNDRSIPPERPFTPSPERPFTLIEHIVEQEVEQVIEQGAKKKKPEVVLPWDTDTFREIWDTWKAERRERRTKAYTARGEQAALHELYTMAAKDEATAAAIIKQSITKGWQGLFPLKNSKNGKPQLTADQQANNRRKLENYVKYGTVTPNGS